MVPCVLRYLSACSKFFRRGRLLLTTYIRGFTPTTDATTYIRGLMYVVNDLPPCHVRSKPSMYVVNHRLPCTSELLPFYRGRGVV